MFLSDRVMSVEPSATVAISTKAMQLQKQGLDIISLSAGEPDFNITPHIAEAMIKAIHEGKTKYTELDGTPELRAAIANKLQEDNQLIYKTDEILVSVGAKHSLYNLFQALLNPGDEVIILAPYWVSYPAMTKLAGATPVILSPLDGLKVTADQIEQAISPKTKLLVLNSPSNPSGEISTREELIEIAKVLAKHPNIWITTDDIYEKIQWSSQEFINILNVSQDLNLDLAKRAVLINGVSKSHAMTGLRIGYAAGPKSIIKAMSKIQGQSTSNPCSIAQAGALAALTGSQEHIPVMVKAYKERQEFLLKKLNQIPGFYFAGTQGAFYAFVDVRGALENLNIKDDVLLCEYLLEKALVAGVPGTAFGMPGFIRFSFAIDIQTLEKACDRLHRALAG